jgi:hypothetical protein
MDVDDAALDRLQSAYKTAVDTWITAIRAEEARGKAEAAKTAYEAGLRSQLFGID